MDQRSICLFVALKGLSAQVLDSELTVVLGADAIAYSTVTKCLRQRQFTSIFVQRSEEPTTIVIDQAILDALEHCPFLRSGGCSLHIHFSYYSPSTPDAITWLCGEASSLGSPHPHTYSKNGACHSLN
jgi:hypothetical protein